LFIGSLLGGLAGLLYKHFKGIDSTPYTGNFYYILIPLLIGAGIGAFIDWIIKRKK
jgi:hypothetical protein